MFLSFAGKIITITLAIMICSYGNISAALQKKQPIYTPQAKEMKLATTNELLKAYLERRTFRHKVLAENIANVNTPGYKAKEVSEAQNYEDLVGDATRVRKVRLARTNPKHMESKRSISSRIATEKLKDPYETKPNGNNVSIAQQMTKLSQNQQDYNTAVKSYATTNALISAVLSGK